MLRGVGYISLLTSAKPNSYSCGLLWEALYVFSGNNRGNGDVSVFFYTFLQSSAVSILNCCRKGVTGKAKNCYLMRSIRGDCRNLQGWWILLQKPGKFPQILLAGSFALPRMHQRHYPLPPACLLTKGSFFMQHFSTNVILQGP